MGVLAKCLWYFYVITQIHKLLSYTANKLLINSKNPENENPKNSDQPKKIVIQILNDFANDNCNLSVIFSILISEVTEIWIIEKNIDIHQSDDHKEPHPHLTKIEMGTCKFIFSMK